MPDIRYTVVPADLHAHLFTVVLAVAEPDPAGQVLVLPAWIRGSYKIRDFARHVVRVEASCEGAPVAVEGVDKSTLRCAPCSGPLRVESVVHAHDPSVREAFLDAGRGFFNPSSLCYRVAGQEQAPCELILQRPVEGGAGWQVATAMPPQQVDVDGFGRYAAEDYEALIDHPFALGTMQRVEFEVGGIPHTLALSGRCAPDVERLRADLTAVCSAERAMFQQQPKLERYVFLCDVQAKGYGGLEHRNSAALVCSRGDLPQTGEATRSRAYRGFLGLVAHEYFHQWNVKRITPQRFAESTLVVEAYIRDLWAYEGVTSYYDDLFILRGGCVDAAGWLDLLAATATRYQRAPGRKQQSLADSSFAAW
ncbi:MAG: M61 family peptidase, partial [Sinobacteraceae bacterium]|nr:M61 family peptidase [Nevskiaceae bacterium]